jgi:hypothetical protein
LIWGQFCGIFLEEVKYDNVPEKDEAHRLIERMPPGATWDDLIREIRSGKDEGGLADSNAGMSFPHEIERLIPPIIRPVNLETSLLFYQILYAFLK